MLALIKLVVGASFSFSTYIFCNTSLSLLTSDSHKVLMPFVGKYASGTNQARDFFFSVFFIGVDLRLRFTGRIVWARYVYCVYERSLLR